MTVKKLIKTSNNSDQSKREQSAKLHNKNTSQLPVTCSKRGKNLRVHGAIGFGFASNWLKNLRGTFKPITKRSNHNCVITFNSHLGTALSGVA